MYRVVLVDDDRLIIRGLSAVVPWADLDCQVVGTATDGVSGLALVRRERPDLLLTDIRMPNVDGLAMAAALRSEFPDLQISVLTAYRDFDYARQAIRLGVCRYLLKPSDLEELREAIAAMIARLGTRSSAAPAGGEPPEEDGGEAHHYVVEAALRWMRDHCTEHLTLNEVADHVYVSQWHLSKLINRETGLGFLDLLNRMRVDRARELLADPSRRVSEIAWEVGFADVAHFSKTFKKLTSRTPGEFRAQALKSPREDA